ncbi:hypothetical protein C0J52_11972 [Blattella germanica]|nr:hypothetical protein C0J52_11972 [Blattella germanica]
MKTEMIEILIILGVEELGILKEQNVEEYKPSVSCQLSSHAKELCGVIPNFCRVCRSEMKLNYRKTLFKTTVNSLPMSSLKCAQAGKQEQGFPTFPLKQERPCNIMTTQEEVKIYYKLYTICSKRTSAHNAMAASREVARTRCAGQEGFDEELGIETYIIDTNCTVRKDSCRPQSAVWWFLLCRFFFIITHRHHGDRNRPLKRDASNTHRIRCTVSHLFCKFACYGRWSMVIRATVHRTCSTAPRRTCCSCRLFLLMLGNEITCLAKYHYAIEDPKRGEAEV